MLLLAFDTSTMGNASVSLCTEHELLCEYTWLAGNNNHSIDLFASIQRIMKEQQITLSQLDAVAVAIGPGSFNGLRVALSAAKGFAFALGKPLIGISTLELIAARQAQWQGLVCAIQEAGRSELYAACYRFETVRGQDGLLTYRPRLLGEYQVLNPTKLSEYLSSHRQEWLSGSGSSPAAPGGENQAALERSAVSTEKDVPESQYTSRPFLFCGEIRETTRQTLLTLLPESCFLDALSSARHASLLGHLAVQRLQDGLIDDPVSLEPLYLRRPSITHSARKQPLLAGIVERPDGHDMTERDEGALRH